MLIRRFAKTRALYLLGRASLRLALPLGLLVPGFLGAHSPFDSNARIIVLPERIEATITTGTGLASELLRDTGIDPTRGSGIGPAKILSLDIGPRIYELEVDGQLIVPQSVRVMSDGLEAMLFVTFPRPASGTVKLAANYAEHLPAGAVSALIVTDDRGNMLSSHIVTDGNKVAEFNLPAPAVAPVAVAPTDLPALENIPTETSGAPPATIVARTPSFLEYLKLGIHHIITGYDHLLFLCGLLVGCKRIRPMLGIITCFTLAHSVTLGLAALNVVSLPARIVEPIIAASIIFVGIENFRRGDNVKARCWLALGFGLIHGFGFAGALRETGLGNTTNSLVSALFSFNFGVELGQLAVAAVFLGLLWQLRKLKPVEQYATPVISAFVIALGGWWLVQRTFLS